MKTDSVVTLDGIRFLLLIFGFVLISSSKRSLVVHWDNGKLHVFAVWKQIGWNGVDAYQFRRNQSTEQQVSSGRSFISH